MNTDRPRLKIQRTRFDIILDAASITGILFIWIFVIIQYSSLPEIIPVHFDFNGKADNYGSKETIFIMPAIITLVTAGLLQLNRFPHIFNYSTKINVDNAHREYTRATRLIRIITLIIVVFVSVFTMDIARSAKEGYSTLTWWIIPLFILSMIIPVVISIYLSSPEKHKAKQ